MSQPFDLSRFPGLPPEVVKAFEAAQFELAGERAVRQHEQAVVAEKDAFIAELKDLIAKLEGQIQDCRRTKFGQLRGVRGTGFPVFSPSASGPCQPGGGIGHWHPLPARCR